MRIKKAFMLPGGPMRFLRSLSDEDPVMRSLRIKNYKEKGLYEPKVLRAASNVLGLFRKTYRNSPNMPMFKGGWEYEGDFYDEFMWKHQQWMHGEGGDPTYLTLDLKKINEAKAKVIVEVNTEEDDRTHLIQRITIQEESIQELLDKLDDYFWKRFQIKLGDHNELRDLLKRRKSNRYNVPEDNRVLLLREVYKEAQRRGDQKNLKYIEDLGNRVKKTRRLPQRDKMKVYRLMHNYDMDPNLSEQWHVVKFDSGPRTRRASMNNILKTAAKTVRKNPGLAKEMAPLVKIALEENPQVLRFKELALTRMNEALKRGGTERLLKDTKLRIHRVSKRDKILGILLAIEEFRKVFRNIRRPAIQKIRKLERMGETIAETSPENPVL